MVYCDYDHYGEVGRLIVSVAVCLRMISLFQVKVLIKCKCFFNQVQLQKKQMFFL